MRDQSISVRTYLGVYVGLLLLLGLTMLVFVWDFGSLNLVASLAIAIAKATLVALFFMHLRYGHPVARIFAAAGVMWLGLLIGLTMCDVLTRSHSKQSEPVQSNTTSQTH